MKSTWRQHLTNQQRYTERLKAKKKCPRCMNRVSGKFICCRSCRRKARNRMRRLKKEKLNENLSDFRSR